MALDVGEKTIGVAVSDPMFVTAQGITTIERISKKKDTDSIIKLLTEYQCEILIIGLPLSLNGTDSIQTEKVRDFKTQLENKLRSTGFQNIRIDYQDERYTTTIAERVLIDANLSREKRKKVIDKQAAVIILQSYLDQNGEKLKSEIK